MTAIPEVACGTAAVIRRREMGNVRWRLAS